MSTRRLIFYLSLAFLAVVLIGLPIKSQVTSQGTTQTETIIAGRNVNMVSGTTLPGGDPWLQRQNEPSIAVSTRNPLHLLAGANDYRTVDMPVSEGELPGKVPTAMVGDAWLGVFTSYDGGESWVSTMLPGYPQDPNANPLKNYRTAADPVVRSGPNGLFYYSGIAFNRDTNLGVVFVARFIDNNNKEGGNSIKYIDTKIIASGTATKFLDKPWIAVDQPRFPFTNITIAGQTFPRHNVYIGYSSFSGTTVTLGDIMFVRSTNCGTTWGTPLKISTGSYAHQGATIAIKPVLGEVLVAWRRFGTTNKSTDSIFVAQSFSRGLNFQTPVKVADIPPFDQPTTDKTQSLPGTLSGPAFRTNSYPTITVDKSGHVYLAWSQRGVGASGGARIMLSSSYLGTNWTSPQPIDPSALSFLGHQIMPSLSFAAGKLILVWYDQRHDVSGAEYGFNNWILDDMPYRHTMDVWAGEADTDTYPNLAWNFSQVSRYLYSVLRDESGDIVFDGSGNPVIFPVQFNCVNYPLFKGGQVPFDGDYIDVAASPEFVMDNWRNWIFNTESSNSPVFHVAWTDNRDVRPPLPPNYDWTNYLPPTSEQLAEYISPEHPSCSGSEGNAPGMRNQNIYTSRITWGIEAGSPTNDKPLNLDVGRAFVIFVKNSTEYLRSFRLTIASQPPGGQASFLQFELLATLDVNIAPYSTISRPVFINSSDINASVTINIDEIDASGNIIAGGLKSSVLINGDPTNPNVPIGEETHNPNIVNQANPNIVNWYVNPNIVNPNIVNPNIVNPNIVNPNIVNPNIVNPNIVNPNIVNPNIVNPNIVNPNIVNRDVPNPNIVNPNIVNPNIVNPNIVNASLEDITIKDVEWTVRNDGNATTSFTLKALAKKSPPPGVYAQLLVYRVHYTPAVAGAELSSAEGISACELKQEPHHELVLNVVNPNIVNPNIVNPNIVNPNIVNSSIENATFSVAPGEEVIVDLRVLDTGVASSGLTTFKALSSGPSIQALNVQDFIDSLGFAVTSQAVNSVDAAQGIETPPAAATTLVIGTSSLPDGVVGIGYNATLSAYGGTAGYAWILNSGELPPGLTLSSGGLISGTPTTEGTYYFIVRVDSGDQFDTQQYSIIINPTSAPQPLQITTTSLPSGVQGYSYGATLEATGGVWPRTWSLAGGSLPPGLSLDSGGVLSGTPTAEGISSFTVRVRDKNGTAATQPLSISISASTSTYYNITGTVYDEYGYPLSDVVLRGLPNTPTTDAYGNYQDKVPEGWSGTVIPFKAEHSFSPSSRTYTNLASSQTGQDYNMGYVSLAISGTVLLGGTGLPGVVMTGLPSDPMTNSDGFYTAAVTYGWSGTVTPTLTGYTFTPPSQAYTNVTSNQTTDYTAALVVGPASKLAFAQSPNGGVGGVPWTSQPVVEVQDSDGNTITSDDSTVVTLAIDNNPGNGSLSGSFSMTVTDGVATFADISIDKGGWGYTLEATSSPLTAATSETFNIEGFSQRAPMSIDRDSHTATYLYTDKILIAGGQNWDGFSRKAELYDAETNTYTPLADMNELRGVHTATLLLNNKVLIAGGDGTSTAELFDPASNTFTLTGSMNYWRYGQPATLLQDGRVLVTGGAPYDGGEFTAEIYDPATGTFSLTGSMQNERYYHTSTRLPDGRVLITGGRLSDSPPILIATAEIYDPSSGLFTLIGNMAGGPRAYHAATLLNNGKVLITGGTSLWTGSSLPPTDTAEIYDPGTNTFTAVGPMNRAHMRHQAILLRDGTVLIVGEGAPEIFDPSSLEFHLTGPSVDASRPNNAAVATKDGLIFVSGGAGTDGYGESSTVMWNPLNPFPTHVISGYVKADAVPVPGVLLAGLPGFPLTDQGGYYEGVVLDGWDGTVTPTKPGYTFDPVSRPYTNVNTDIPAQDYTTTGMPTYTISGTVTVGGLGLEGVVMSGLPGNPTTNSDGFYTGTVTYGWSGTVTPTLAHYHFTPSSQDYSNVTSNQTTNYTAQITQYQLNVNKAGTGAGTVTSDDGEINCGGTCQKNYDYGTNVQLTAAWALGSTFAGWSGDVPEGQQTANPATIVMDGNKNVTANFNLIPPLVITTTSIPDGMKATAYDTTLQFAGGLPPVTWSIISGSLPSSLSLNPGTGQITGTPTVSGYSSFTVQAQDATPQTATQALSMTVGDWVARYDGSGNSRDDPRALAVDSFGNVYVTGMSIPSYDPNDNYATVKYNSGGVQQWVAGYDGPSNSYDYALALALDSAGNVYVTGETAGGTGMDYATIKYDANGNQTWLASYSGPGNDNDTAYALAVDSSGNVYVTGWSIGSGTGNDYATVKYNSSGVQQWVARYSSPGNGSDRAFALALDSAGNVYVTGETTGSTGLDYATIKYDTNGNQIWVVGYNSPENYDDAARALALDSSGNVYVTGSTGSGLGQDYATVKYNSNGVQQWVARYDGPKNSRDEASALAVDSSGNVYVTGCSIGLDIGLDYATVKYNDSGVQQWVARYNGPLATGNDEASALALDAVGNVYVTGYSWGGGTAEEYATVKYDSGGNQIWVARYNGPGNDQDRARALALDAVGNVYVTGLSTGIGGTGYNYFDYATIRYTQSFPETLIISTETLDNGYVSTPYAATIWAFGSSGSRTWSKINGDLPPGMDLSLVTGIIAGTPTTPGTYNFTVQVVDGSLVATKPLSITIGTFVGPPHQLAFSQQPSDTVVGATITPAVTVEIQDSEGNRVENATDEVTIAINSGTAGAILSGDVTKNAVNGVATFDDLSIDTVGTYTLVANSGSLTEVISLPFEITTSPAFPEINIKQIAADIDDGGSYDFGSHAVGSNTDVTFTIENTGPVDLTLVTPLIIGGADAGQFSVRLDPTSPVLPGDTTGFIIRFSPTSEGAKSASIAIGNNDADENPYDITLMGTVTETYEFVTKWGSAGDGDGQFQYPCGIALDSLGNVCVADTNNNRIQKFTSSGVFVTKWGSLGSGDGQFAAPYFVAVDGLGEYVYVTDAGNGRIQKFTSSGVFVTKWGNAGSGDGQFNFPYAIAVDSTGYVYVTDFNNDRVQKFNSDGVFVTKWGSAGDGDGQFDSPAGIAVDSSGYVYVSDYGNARIQKFTSGGTFVTKWGSLGSGDGQFNNPAGIAVDSSEYICVADANNNRIQKFTSGGTFVTKWGNFGTGDGQFNRSQGIAVDSPGYVYVTDYHNHRIQKFRRKQ